MAAAARRILIADAVDERAREVFAADGLEAVYRPEISPEELLDAIAGFSALVVRSRTAVTAEVLAAGRALRVVGRAGAGVDNVDLDEATRRGIVVMNTPGGNTVSTAEHTLSMLLALARNIPAADRSVKAMEWRRSAFTGTEVAGKTLGLIGLGKVGQEVAARAIALGMRVLASDPLVTDEACRKIGAEPTDLPGLYRRADFISIHTPLLPETRNLIDAASLRLCRPGVRIINCARGGIVNERDLVAAIDGGIVAGAALDVFEKEPPDDRALLTHPKVICTPHLGASTGEAQEKVAIQIARQVSDFLLDRAVTGSVNADLIRIAMRGEMAPVLDLCHRMGRMMAQLHTGPITGVRAVVRGPLPEDAGDAVLASLLRGLLSSLLSENVNLVNAGVLARERGLTASVAREAEGGRYPTEIEAECVSGATRRSIGGTLIGARDVRIISLDGYHFEARPEGHLLCYYNLDRPGMLARVSAVLARHGVNIADLSLGRRKPGKKALTVVATDEPVTGEILREIAEIEGISDIHAIRLDGPVEGPPGHT